MNDVAYVYKITNKVNGKIYIGIARDRAVFSRWHEHSKTDSSIGKALDIYGIESFQFEVIESLINISDSDLFRLESKYITKYNSINNGYNMEYSYDQGRNVSKGKPKVSELTEAGLIALRDKCYTGTPEDNINNKMSFWRLLQEDKLCFVELLTSKNYFTNKNSKYNEPLKLIFSGRKQRYFKIEHASYEYTTDNIESIVDFMSMLYEENDRYKLLDFSSNSESYEIKFIDTDYGEFTLSIYGTLLYDDELMYTDEVDSVRDVYKDFNVSSRRR